MVPELSKRGFQCLLKSILRGKNENLQSIPKLVLELKTRFNSFKTGATILYQGFLHRAIELPHNLKCRAIELPLNTALLIVNPYLGSKINNETMLSQKRDSFTSRKLIPCCPDRPGRCVTIDVILIVT